MKNIKNVHINEVEIRVTINPVLQDSNDFIYLFIFNI